MEEKEMDQNKLECLGYYNYWTESLAEWVQLADEHDADVLRQTTHAISRVLFFARKLCATEGGT